MVYFGSYNVKGPWEVRESWNVGFSHTHYIAQIYDRRHDSIHQPSERLTLLRR